MIHPIPRNTHQYVYDRISVISVNFITVFSTFEAMNQLHSIIEEHVILYTRKDYKLRLDYDKKYTTLRNAFELSYQQMINESIMHFRDDLVRNIKIDGIAVTVADWDATFEKIYCQTLSLRLCELTTEEQAKSVAMSLS